MTVSAAAISGSDYYAADNYYTGDQEGPSSWGGRGAEELGLTGTVEAEMFARVLDGTLPNGAQLERSAGGTRSNGVDLTFSAPKSVSLVAMIGGDARVAAAHARAVEQTMAWAEERFATARAGKGGREHIATGNLVYAAFHHDLSRKLDPQLHTHVAIANATQRPDGAWRALHNRPLWQNSPLIGAAYHAQLRANLAQLGYDTVITGRHGQFEISGISREAITAFSARREEIRARAEALGISSPKGREAVALRTRDAKQAGDAVAARTLWAEKAVAHRDGINRVVASALEQSRPRSLLQSIIAWGEALLERVTHAFRPRPEPLMTGGEKARGGAQLAAAYSVAAGVRHVAERQASFEDGALLRAALGFAEKGATVREIEARIGLLVREGVLIRGRSASIHAGRLTTRDLLQTERALVKAAREGAGAGQALMSPEQVRTGLGAVEGRTGLCLSDEQVRGLDSLLVGLNRIQVIQGDAGTGKSTLFAFAREIAAQAGRSVVFLTAQGSLVAAMRNAGLDAHTVASVIGQTGSRAAKCDPATKALLGGRLVVVEEASMLSSRQMAGLIAITEQAGAAKLAFVGDAAQIGAPAAGRPLALLQQEGAPTERLAENRRQQTPELRAAVAYAREGNIGAVFAVLGDRVCEDRSPARAAARHYLSLTPAERERTAVLTSGHVLREQVLAAIRTGLMQEGTLGWQALGLRSLDRLNLTREELRQIAHWAPGMQLDLYRRQAGLEPGSYQVAQVSHADHLVQLRRNGKEHYLDPASLHPSGLGAALSVPGEMEVRTGDHLVFTAADHSRELVNGTRAICIGIEGADLHLRVETRDMVLGEGDPMRDRLGHAAVLNMHRAQGITVDRALTIMHSENRLLNSTSLHYVLQTRAREEVVLFTDDREELRSSIENSPGHVPHALDLAPELADGGGERFDPATGEVREPAQDRSQPTAADLFAREMARLFNEPAPAKAPVRERDEPQREMDDQEIDYDFER